MDFDIITNNLKKGFDVWKENLVAYLVAMIIVTVAMYVLTYGTLTFGLLALISGSAAGLGMGLGVLVIGGLLLLLVLAPLEYGVFYMALKGTRGEKIEIGDLFYAFKSVSAYIRALIFMVVFVILCAIFSIIPFIGTLIFAVLFFYAGFIYIMTPSEGVVYALKESFNIAKDNLVITIVALLVFAVLLIIGGIVVIGTIITMPIAYIFLAYVLKELKPGIRDES